MKSIENWKNFLRKKSSDFQSILKEKKEENGFLFNYIILDAIFRRLLLETRHEVNRISKILLFRNDTYLREDFFKQEKLSLENELFENKFNQFINYDTLSEIFIYEKHLFSTIIIFQGFSFAKLKETDKIENIEQINEILGEDIVEEFFNIFTILNRLELIRRFENLNYATNTKNKGLSQDSDRTLNYLKVFEDEYSYELFKKCLDVETPTKVNISKFFEIFTAQGLIRNDRKNNSHFYALINEDFGLNITRIEHITSKLEPQMKTFKKLTSKNK